MPQQVPEYIARIRLHYDNLHGAEKKLADYLLALDTEEPLEDSVKQLASKAGVSVASVVRFCQTMGYGGYAEFKLVTRQRSFLPSVGNITLNGTMPAEGLIKNICDFATLQIKECAKTLNSQQMDAAINAIRGARRLLVCGAGTSAGIITAAANAFMNINIPSYPLTEELLARRVAAMAGPGDVFLGVSNCGYIKTVVDTLMLAKQAGATTILVTGAEDSLAHKYADHVLRSNIYGRPTVLDMLTVTICQMITIQILQAGCLARGASSALPRMRSNSELVEMVRYAESVDEVSCRRVKC